MNPKTPAEEYMCNGRDEIQELLFTARVMIFFLPFQLFDQRLPLAYYAKVKLIRTVGLLHQFCFAVY